MLRRTQRNQRAQLLRDAEALLAKPSVQGNWRTALARAHEFSDLLGMKPDIRRDDGFRIVEESYTSGMGYRFSLTLPEPEDTRLTPGQAQAVFAGATLEEALRLPVGEDESGGWLSEEELTQLLEKLSLTEGWNC